MEKVAEQVPYRSGITMELQDTLDTVENNLMANIDIGYVSARGLTIADAYDLYSCQIAIHRAKGRAIRYINKVRSR